MLIKDFNKFVDRGIFNNARDDPLSGHLLALEGEEWRQMRSKISPVFTSGKMKQMFAVVMGIGQQLKETCDGLLQQQATEVELKDLFARFTTDVIGNCVFGIECNSLKDPQTEFRQHGRDIMEKPRHNGLITAFIMGHPELARKLRMKLFSDTVSDFFLGAVCAILEYRQQSKERRNDFIELLLEVKAESKGALSLEEIAAQAFVFFVAGFDTSSSTMAFTLYELARNVEIQQKVRQEILKVQQAHNGAICYESLSELHYLEQVLAGKF